MHHSIMQATFPWQNVINNNNIAWNIQNKSIKSMQLNKDLV